MDTSKRKLFLGRELKIRPPWSLAGDEFFEHCTRCGSCLTACPEKIIVADRLSYPFLDFHRGSCSFCGDCRTVCRDVAVKPSDFAFHGNESPWSHCVHIAESCLAVRGVLCRICGEECEALAISFSLRQGGFSVPQIDNSLCTGCGACFHPCPVSAVSLS